MLLGVAASVAGGQVPKADKGATCASCHVSFATTQPLTPMGRAMQLPGANPVLAEHAKMVFQNGVYTYTVATVGSQSTYSVTDGTRTITLPIQWGFGAKAQTWMLEREGTMYESLVSYYPDIGGLALTTGDDKLKPQTLEEAIGRPQTANDAKACFGCHSTSLHAGAKLDLASLKLDTAALKPGLTCEHCHVGAEQHQVDRLLGKLGTLPPDLGEMSTEQMSNFCGNCHRPWEMVVRSRWRGEMNVRFQPYRLANSKCYVGTDPRIGCVACHDPHKDVVREESYYDGKCLACHASAGSLEAKAVAVVKVADGREAKACPVATKDCTSCHMPKVTLPGSGGHLRFTDHEIRVVRAGDLYPN